MRSTAFRNFAVMEATTVNGASRGEAQHKQVPPLAYSWPLPYTPSETKIYKIVNTKIVTSNLSSFLQDWSLTAHWTGGIHTVVHTRGINHLATQIVTREYLNTAVFEAFPNASACALVSQSKLRMARPYCVIRRAGSGM